MLDFVPVLLPGAWLTVQITVYAAGFSVALGALTGVVRVSRTPLLAPVRLLARAYVATFRGTSALVQLFWLFFVLPHFGINLPAMMVAVIALSLNIGAYGSEVVRGALQAVPRGQYEAATALNLGPLQTMWRIILPQAVVAMLPPWGNLFIELLKATALVSLITISDLTFRAYQLNQATFRTMEIFTLVLLMYLVIALAITFAMRYLERLTARGHARGGLG